MREIFFRGKRKDNGEWVYGYYAHIPCGRFKREEHLIQTIKKDGTIGMIYDVIPDTVDQYTGLIDKTGQKIFEGDIVLYDNSRFFVKYTEGFAAFSLRDAFNMKYTPALTPILAMRMEVIGNIHDTPELLEAEK